MNKITTKYAKKYCVLQKGVVQCEYDKEEGVCYYEDTGRIDRWFQESI
jgi:hypothetical protein